MQDNTTPATLGPLRLLSSLYFGAVILVLLLVALACATVYESMRGTEHALFVFYRSFWFLGLLALLCINVLAAVTIRMPIPRAKLGFVVTHLSLVLILVGALVTKFVGVDGQLALIEGESAKSFRGTSEEITLVESGTKQETSEILSGGPFGGLDPATELSGRIASIGTVSVEVNEYLPDAIPVSRVEETGASGQPAIQVSFSDGSGFEPKWLFAGRQETINGLAFRYTPVAGPDDLPNESDETSGSEPASLGTVEIELESRSLSLPLEACLNQYAAIDESPYSLRVVEYLPHAIVGKDNKLTNASPNPNNPAIRVEIMTPEGKEERIAFAKFPDFDSMHGDTNTKNLKIKFLFAGGKGAAANAGAPVEVFSTPAGDLRARFGMGSATAEIHQLALGKPVDAPWGEKRLTVLRKLDRARAVRSFEVVDPPRERRQPAVRVSISNASSTDAMWLPKNTPETFTADGRRYEILYRDQTIPLGFDVHLKKFTVGYYPGGGRPRSFESQITIADNTGLSQNRVISMNNPTAFGGYTLYQSSYQLSGTKAMSILSVAKDPGLPVVFAGYIGLLLGMTWVLVSRIRDRRLAADSGSAFASSRRNGRGRRISLIPPASDRCVDDPDGITARGRIGSGSPGNGARGRGSVARTTPLVVLAMLMCGSLAAKAIAADVPKTLDYSVVRGMTLQHDGRWPPLDTVARDLVEEVTGDMFFGGIDPVAHLLAWTFDARTWQQEPLISISNGELRRELQLPDDKTLFSFQGLLEHAPLREQIERLSRLDKNQKLDPLQAKVSDINGRLIQLQQIFRGKVIRLIPDAVDPLGAWSPIGPAKSAREETSELTAVRNAWQSLAQAFLADDAAGFSSASSALVSASSALPAASRPAEALIKTELRYNRMQPFGVAWKIMVVAALFAAFSMLVRNRWFDVLPLVGLVAGFAILTYGLWLRWQIAGRIPASNMFESLLFLSWGMGAFAILSIFVFKDRTVPLTASAMGALSLLLADLLPINHFIRPIAPVLSDTIWMSIHVPVIMVSYSVLALAVVVAHAQLVLMAVAPHKTKLSTTIDALHYWYVHVGSILLAAGIITGSMWAASSWGRYWGWDPKEVWSLVALLGYLTILHVRIDRDRLPKWAYLLAAVMCAALFAVVVPKLAPLTAGKILALFGTLGGMIVLVFARGLFATCAKSILCFWLIIMTYVGVNYVLGTGLHSYGFGTGAVVKYMFLSGAIDLGFVAVCTIVYVLGRRRGLNVARGNPVRLADGQPAN